ncbi:helix-turn-helix domain-containing protein [Paenibacillus polymyxa]|uniref:helix-turn-helix domain-containing protein n=1 Tax=Paenibacillus polymyxa TaxID=1406 RepID=UPI001866A36E|nr:helix-turn-helix domain-containing protein [Paenibacillus polymyxa]MBE3650933.1 helix-turn-helix domain-containing protein [Paenibacillus polymyxa]
MENELFDLVSLAQNGDKEALAMVISYFLPNLRHARSKVKPDSKDDLEQSIVEVIIKKVLTYDLANVPDFTKFCRQFGENQSLQAVENDFVNNVRG